MKTETKDLEYQDRVTGKHGQVLTEKGMEMLEGRLKDRQSDRNKVKSELDRMSKIESELDEEVRTLEERVKAEKKRGKDEGDLKKALEEREKFEDELKETKGKLEETEGELEKLRRSGDELDGLVRRIAAGVEKFAGQLKGSVSVLGATDPNLTVEGKVEIAQLMNIARDLPDLVWGVLRESTDLVREIVTEPGPKGAEFRQRRDAERELAKKVEEQKAKSEEGEKERKEWEEEKKDTDRAYGRIA